MFCFVENLHSTSIHLLLRFSFRLRNEVYIFLILHGRTFLEIFFFLIPVHNVVPSKCNSLCYRQLIIIWLFWQRIANYILEKLWNFQTLIKTSSLSITLYCCVKRGIIESWFQSNLSFYHNFYSVLKDWQSLIN